MNQRRSIELIDVAQAAFLPADQLVTAAQQQATVASACSPGCNWCCFSKVEVTVPEAKAVHDQIRARLSESELCSLSLRLAETDRRTRCMDKVSRLKSRIPCPLLCDQGCTVYEVRPIVCRGWNSYDATSCKLAFLGEMHESWIPINEGQYTSVKEFSRNLALSFTGSARDGELFDLTTVLSMSLVSPGLFDRWLVGESVFVEATAQ